MQNRAVFPPAQLDQLRISVGEMMEFIDDHLHHLKDPARGPPPAVLSLVPTAGRPRIAVDVQFLRTAHEMRDNGHIGRQLGISSRTVRRRLLEAGIDDPQPPVFIPEPAGGADPPRLIHNPASVPRARPTHPVQDDALDRAVAELLARFPNHGRSMMIGQLRAAGFTFVSRKLVRASIRRVTGVPAQFGRQPIRRREYRVPGPGSLWHHDGQHGTYCAPFAPCVYASHPFSCYLLGLIRWKIVIHAFIDGYSRFVLGIRASNNNRAETVETLFREIIHVHGAPSRVRGDHGVENVLVARLMETLRGTGRGSYIWGKSVHNVRIERLWVDVVKGFVNTWRNFFTDLEGNHGLDVNEPLHICLLQHLFLPCINADSSMWAEGWNHHTFSRLPNHPRGTRLPTPRDLYFFGVHDHGVRAMDVIDEDLPDHELADYGIDWHEDNDEVMRLHWVQNPPQDLPDDELHPDRFAQPRRLVEVRVPVPINPLGPAAFDALDAFLRASPDLNMQATQPALRRLWWIKALEFLAPHAR